MSSIATLCAIIEPRIFSNPSVSRDSFLPGLDQAEMVRSLSALGFTPKPDLIELYGWRNGQDYTALFDRKTLPFYGRFFFLPLAEAIKRNPKPGELDDWMPNWLPVFDDYAGDIMFIDMKDVGEESPIGRYETTSDDLNRASVAYCSIEAFLTEVAEHWATAGR